jgi:hypothetical protein
MKLSKDQCHICLDDVLYFTGKNKPRCSNESCNGYICNQCWDNLVVEDIETCPLCRQNIDTSIYDLEIDNVRVSASKFSKKIIFNFLINLFLGIVGFIVVYVYCMAVGNSLILEDEINNRTYKELLIALILFPAIGMIFCLIFTVIISSCHKFCKS